MEEDHRSVKIIEVCKVAPPPHSVAPNSLPLTFFDLLWLRFPPIQRLFFYQLSSTETQTPSIDAILPKLKTSLSLLLPHYLPVAGNIIWPQHSSIPVVEFVEGDGVFLTVAQSGADFCHLSSNGFREAAEYHPLVPQLPVSPDRAAVIALQLTLFPNFHGFSIGIANHHAILDGKTSTSFINSWARICNLDVAGGSSSELMPFYDRSVIGNPAGLAEIFANVWMDLGGPNNRSLNLWLPKTPPGLVRCSLELTGQNLQKLRQWVLKKKKKQQALRISSFMLTTAYLCVCTAKSEGSTDEKAEIIFAMDVRSRLQPPIPSNYFGNCLVGCPIGIERSELLGENGMVVAMEAITETIRSVEEEPLKGAENWCSVMKAAINGGSARKPPISISGSPRFEVYSADFGWGKPKKVEMVSIESSGAFSLAESKNGDGGIEIGLVRERNQLESFATLFAEGLESL